MALTLITKPARDLFAFDEIKDLIGVDADALPDFNAEVFLWLRGATDWVERYTNHTLRESTWRLTLSEFPSCPYVPLPLYPVQSVSSIQYRDANGTLQTWDASKYLLVLDDPASVNVAPGETWPVTQAYRPDAVLIDFVAGYELQTDDSYDAPDAMKLAVQSFVRDRWNRRNRLLRDSREDIDEPSDVLVKAMLEPVVRVPTSVASTPNVRG